MNKKIKIVSLVFYLIGILSCSEIKTKSTEHKVENSEELNIKVDYCKVDAVLKNANYLFSNKDTLTVLKKEQLLCPLDLSIRELLNNHKYGDYFYVSSYNFLENISMVSYFDDEVENPTVYLATIKNCKLISNLVVAQSTYWEHGSKTTKSLIHKDKTIEKITYSTSKDWGDYKEWKYDTTIIRYKINDEGKIEEFN